MCKYVVRLGARVGRPACVTIQKYNCDVLITHQSMFYYSFKMMLSSSCGFSFILSLQKGMLGSIIKI